MKLTKVKFLHATLVALGIAVMPANAAVDTTWDANDVILGFRAAASTTGAGSTLLVNLGSAAGYRSTTTNINSIANLGSIIDSVYGTTAGSGSAWYERTDLWAGFVSATNGLPGNNSGGVAIASQTTDYNSTVYLSSRRSGQGTVGSLESEKPGDYGQPLNLPPAADRIGNVRSVASNLDNTASDLLATRTTSGVVVFSSSTTNSWNSYVTGNTDVDFDIFDLESNFGSGVAFASFGGVSNVEQAWDFYRVASNPPSDVNAGVGLFEGTFTLDQSGNVDFIVTSAAVPEPSTYMMSGLALAFGAYLLRRKKQKNANQQTLA